MAEDIQLYSLRLPNLIEEKIEEDENQILVHCRIRSPSTPECGCFIPEVRKNGTKKVMFYDAPISGKKVGIWVSRQRYQCTGPGHETPRTFYEQVPHMHWKHDMTERLVEYIHKNAGTRRSFTDVAQEIGMDPQTVRRVWIDYAQSKMKEIGPITPEWLGIDEVMLMKKYRCIITNVQHNTMIDLLVDRKVKTIVAYLGGMLEPEKIKVVTIDMNDSYREAVKIALPHARLVVDRFHVTMHCHKALEAVRMHLRNELPPAERIGLMRDRWLFQKAEERLSTGQQIVLHALLEQYPLLKKGHAVKESYRRVWDCKTVDEAKARYDEWAKTIPPEVEYAFKPLLTAMQNWREEIFAYFDLRLTNAYTESLNALVRRMDAVGRGFSFPVLRARLLMAYSAHKREPVPFQRVLSTPQLAAFIQGGGLLGWDISTLADEMAAWPDSE